LENGRLVKLGLGFFGDLVWRHFPESRAVIRLMILRKLGAAIDAETAPELPDQFAFLVDGVTPLVRDRIGVVELDTELVQRFCEFCRDVLAGLGPEDHGRLDTFDSYVLEEIDDRFGLAAVTAADPGLVDLVRERFPNRWRS
jgi:hypothetical protein